MLQFNFDPFPVLETERLILRKFAPEHAPRMFELRTNDDVMRYIERPRPSSVDDIHELFRSTDDLLHSQNGIAWAICMKEENMLVGTIGFWRMKKEHHRAEIGYMLLPQYWRKGIVSEAMKEVMRYAFDEMKLHSIEADINPQNEASAGILEKLGFTREAYFRENFYWKGKYLDSAIYSLLEGDYRRNA